MGESGEKGVDKNKLVGHVDVEVGCDPGHGEVWYMPKEQCKGADGKN